MYSCYIWQSDCYIFHFLHIPLAAVLPALLLSSHHGHNAVSTLHVQHLIESSLKPIATTISPLSFSHPSLYIGPEDDESPSSDLNSTALFS